MSLTRTRYGENTHGTRHIANTNTNPNPNTNTNMEESILMTQEEEDAEQQLQQERQQDEDEMRFFEWMSEHQLPLPLQCWHDSKRRLDSVLSTRGMYRCGLVCTGYGRSCPPMYRLALLREAACYYVLVHGGTQTSVLAQMILYYQ